MREIDQQASAATSRGDRQQTESLKRGLAILRCFSPERSRLSNQDISAQTGLPKATVSRLAYTLTQLGYLVHSKETGLYRVGPPVLSLGFACLSGIGVRDVAQPYMQNMAEYAGPGILVALGARDDFSITYVGCSRSSGMISLLLNVGSRVSLARSAIGRAYIAGLEENERARVVSQLRERAGSNWPIIEEGILKSVAQVRERGFCVNLGEWQPDVHSIAVPFSRVRPDEPLLAFNCGGPSYLLKPERLIDDLGPRLVEMAQRVRMTLSETSYGTASGPLTTG